MDKYCKLYRIRIHGEIGTQLLTAGYMKYKLVTPSSLKILLCGPDLKASTLRSTEGEKKRGDVQLKKKNRYCY